MFRRLLFLCLALWLYVPVPSAHTQAEANNSPYIYYFSDDLNAFVIERADGTDSRILGDSVMPVMSNWNDIAVDGPGWSPSGQWFAWTAEPTDLTGPGYDTNLPYAVRTDGTQRLELLDNFENAQLAWADDRDVLFVVARDAERIPRENLSSLLAPDYDPQTVEIFIAADQAKEQLRESPMATVSIVNTHLMAIDVANGVLLGSFTYRTFSDYYRGEIASAVQTNDRDHFMMVYRDECSYFLPDCGFTHIVTIDVDGTITDQALIANTILESISTAGWAVYVTENGMEIENILTGEAHSFPSLSEPQQILWDASGRYAVISNEGLWLLDCDTTQLTLLREDGNWSMTGFYSPRTERLAWSPDSSFVLLFNADNSLLAINREDRTVTELPVDAGEIFYSLQWYWMDGSHVMLHYQSEIIIYDLLSLSAQHITVDLDDNSDPRLSPDGRYIAFVDDGPVLYDTATAGYQNFRPSYRSFQSFIGGEVAWHDNGKWLLIFEEALVAGGAYLRDLGIMRSDGTQHRDLGFVQRPPSTITLNWLPSQVDPEDLPPSTALYTLQPNIIFHGSHWSFYVDWSPDGNSLAAGLGWGSVGEITVWGVDTGQVVTVFEDSSETDQVEWPQNPQLFPALVAHNVSNNMLARSPDGRQFVQWREQIPSVIDADTGRVLAGLESNSGFYFSATYSPDGRFLATASHSYPVHIWDTTTWEIVATLPNRGQAVVFSPDSSQLAVTASWDVQIWDVESLLEARDPDQW